MNEIKRIQNDLKKGYNVSRFGTIKALHDQMLKDIEFLNRLLKSKE